MSDHIDRATDAKKGTPYLTTDQAARYIGLSSATLEKMRRKGRGPRYRKHGRYVRYHVDDLTAWSDLNVRTVTERRVMPSRDESDPS